MVMQYSRNARLIQLGSALMTTTILVVAVDTVWLLFRLKRALRAKFPDETLQGHHLLHGHARAPAALHADAQAAGEDRRRSALTARVAQPASSDIGP